ncbi:MAG: hypothetical protein DLM53_00255 [Candidatus Eremiobacter antarcticus]|nr:MAG: hypothetical protein DLM53_00255 [Candidatus Eremiobacter sp. RRmetagenome_bin22]
MLGKYSSHIFEFVTLLEHSSDFASQRSNHEWTGYALRHRSVRVTGFGEPLQLCLGFLHCISVHAGYVPLSLVHLALLSQGRPSCCRPFFATFRYGVNLFGKKG